MKDAIDRNLRGQELAAQVTHLNGHQNQIRFIIFQKCWFFMILSISLSGLISILKYVALFGVLGFCFEVVLWATYFIRHGSASAYPGLPAWFDVQIRRRVMALGRNASRFSRP